jgi:TonB family protein
MAETTRPGGHVNSSAGHVSVHFEEAHPPEVSFLFEQHEKRLAPAFIASLVWHIGFAVLVVVAIRYGSTEPQAVAELPYVPSDRIVWIPQEGPGGGGGGGGNQMKEPPRAAELPGKDRITVPVSKPPAMEVPKEKPQPEPDPVAQLNIPAQTLAAAANSLPGLIEAPPGPPTASQGAGTGGGAGTGAGTGSGPGTGSGLGPGSGGGTGGGAYRLGTGVTTPVIVSEVKPQYTSDAMRAKISGTVWVECIVQPDGAVSDVRIVRSLDNTFGLDQEAIKAVRQWRFRPGTLQGQPVPVLITVELAFTLR